MSSKMKKILLSASFFATVLCSAQVGIGTSNPQQVLHVDALKNNTTTTTNKNDDDVVVNASGQLGIGTINPMTKVDVRSSQDSNAIGIGNTTLTAAAAGAGALRYNTVSKFLEYSDGTNWVPLAKRGPNDFCSGRHSCISNRKQRNHCHNNQLE